MHKQMQTLGTQPQLNAVILRLFQISLSLPDWQYGPLQRLTSSCNLQPICMVFGDRPMLAPPGLYSKWTNASTDLKAACLS